MPRARQLSLALEKARRRDRRKRTGRTRRQFLADGKPTAPHVARPEFEQTRVLHVTLRALPVIGRLRNLDAYAACRGAQRVVLARTGFRLLHYSIQHNHVHLIVEADSKRDLANGMRAFQISMTKQLNRRMSGRTGRVFADRYHARMLRTPTEMRNAIRYVLNNWRHHGEVTGYFADLVVDPYSSGAEHLGWRELPEGRKFYRAEGFEAPHLAEAQTWLARVGWQRAGSISVYSVPGGSH